MSSRFSVAGDVIEEGAVVLLSGGPGRIEQVEVRRGATVKTKFGRFCMDELVGRRYGERIGVQTMRWRGGDFDGSGFIYVLRPRPELLAEGALSLQTAIVDAVDSAHIVWALSLRPGCVVVESGTGSGSLTRCLARAVAPHGRVLTFEFHSGRAERVRAALAQERCAASVEVTHRNVCSDGFGAGVPDGSADAVMLDLPTPWKVVSEARRVLRPQGRICCYSPCVEQVQRNCAKLRARGFTAVETVEVVQRPYHLFEHAEVFEPVDYEPFDPSQRTKRSRPDSDSADRWWYRPDRSDSMCALPATSIRGHTAFLTFATLPPRPSTANET